MPSRGEHAERDDRADVDPDALSDARSEGASTGTAATRPKPTYSPLFPPAASWQDRPFRRAESLVLSLATDCKTRLAMHTIAASRARRAAPPAHRTVDQLDASDGLGGPERLPGGSREAGAPMKAGLRPAASCSTVTLAAGPKGGARPAGCALPDRARTFHPGSNATGRPRDRRAPT